MATIRTLSLDISSITFTTTGVVAGVDGVFADITPNEATHCVQQYEQPYLVSSNPTTGNCVIKMPSVISSITVNGNVYGVDGSGNINAVIPVDANELLYEEQTFQLVTG